MTLNDRIEDIISEYYPVRELYGDGSRCFTIKNKIHMRDEIKRAVIEEIEKLDAFYDDSASCYAKDIEDIRKLLKG